MKEEKVTNNIKLPDNVEILKKHFPHCFDKNGNFDFDKFKKELSKSEDINFSKESYSLDWLGKSYARLLATDEATTLLKEDEEWNNKPENKDSENILIKGDNLEVLKHLSNAYHEKIKIIYIDPPYNTGNDDFVYQDNRKFTVEELSHLAGIDEEKAKRILDFVNSKSNSHSAWLTFMYPRLYIAKYLLKDDGVIFVSIDDNEVAQLRILMDEIFGEENFVALVPRKTWAWAAATNSEEELRKMSDFVLIYKKFKVKFKKKIVGQKKFPYSDAKGKYNLVSFQASGSDATRNARPNMYYQVYLLKDGRLTTKEVKDYVKKILPKKIELDDGRWIRSKEKFEKNKDEIVFINGELKRKVYLDPTKDNNKYQVEKAWFENFPNKNGTIRIKELFNFKVFNNPKPVELIKFLLNIVANYDDLILDFFAGSWTTGDAVMQLNAEDWGNRKFILVQLPEPIDPKKNKTAYDFVKNELWIENPTIFDITKERLIRAAKKIKEENKDKDYINNLDFGFKIFETIPNDEWVWENLYFKAEEFKENQKLFDESKLTDEDLKVLLTTWKTYDNIPLTQKLKEIDLDGYKAYYFDTKLYLIHSGFKTKNLKKLLEEIDSNPDFNPATIIAFGYNLDSKSLREIAENINSYSNKKNIDIYFVIRY